MPRSARALLAAIVVGVTALLIPISGLAQTAAELCQPPEPGVNCGPGNNRTTVGGGAKAPHNDGMGHNWPRVSGILWMVIEDGRQARRQVGGPDNDELLGHHGDDHLSGAGGDDIIWGDWDPARNNSKQRDILSGGAGNDWLYPSHGRVTVLGGPGRDYVYAYYGKGTIDCGPGRDTARVRTTGAYKVRNCEVIRHFCAFGENKQGQCLSPTGKPVATPRRRG